MNTLVRFYNDGIKDSFSKPDNIWLSLFSSTGTDGKFTTDNNNKCMFCQRDVGIYNFTEKESTTYNFGTSSFTICFWIKFYKEFCNADNSIVTNKIYIQMENGDIFTYEFIPDTEWHHYAFIRIDNVIRVYIDGVLIESYDTEAEFNLESNSFIYIGQPMQYCMGDRFYIDDVFISNTPYWNKPTFDVPDGYLPINTAYILYTRDKDKHNEASYGTDYTKIKYIE